MKIDYLDIVGAELIANDITLCSGCSNYNSHSRGFALPDRREVHYSAKMATRKTLHGFLHEVGHIVNGHGKACTLRRFEREAQAEEYATRSLRMYGVAVPREAVSLGKRYVKRMKEWGDNIKRSKKLLVLVLVFWTFRGTMYSVSWDLTGRAHVKMVEATA